MRGSMCGIKEKELDTLTPSSSYFLLSRGYVREIFGGGIPAWTVREQYHYGLQYRCCCLYGGRKQHDNDIRHWSL